jgi:hypothetical protein
MSAWPRFLLPQQLRKPFLHELCRPSFVIVFVALLFTGNWLGNNVVFEPPAKWFGDFLLRTREKKVAAVTRIVRIDPRDQDCVLGGVATSGIALIGAVKAIAASSPAVIVVDIDTSDPKSFPEGLQLPSFGVPVIWAVNADWEEGKQGLSLKAGRVLGGRLRDMPLYAIARMPVGFDGFLRGWQRTFIIDGHDAPSLPVAAVEEYCKARHCAHAHETSFARDYIFARMNLSEFAPALARSETQKDCDAGSPPETDPRLAGKIVVVGGFSEGADRHDTPWGTKFGAEAVASAIEEDLNPDGLGHIPVVLKWFLKGLIAIGIAALHHYFRPIWATLLTVLLLPLAVVLSGLAIFWYGDYELTVVPLAVGILLEQLATSAEKAEHFVQHAEHHQ